MDATKVATHSKQRTIKPAPPDADSACAAEDNFVPSLAVVYEHLVKLSPPRKGQQITRFHAVKPPYITISHYLERIRRYFGCSNECFVLSLVYIDRIVKIHEQFSVSILNIHRLLVTSVMLAAKFFDDIYYSNAFYARVGGVRTREINILEAHFLSLLDFHLFVSAEEYEQYRRNVLTAVCDPSVHRPPPARRVQMSEEAPPCEISSRLKSQSTGIEDERRPSNLQQQYSSHTHQQQYSTQHQHQHHNLQQHHNFSVGLPIEPSRGASSITSSSTAAVGAVGGPHMDGTTVPSPPPQGSCVRIVDSLAVQDYGTAAETEYQHGSHDSTTAAATAAAAYRHRPPTSLGDGGEASVPITQMSGGCYPSLAHQQFDGVDGNVQQRAPRASRAPPAQAYVAQAQQAAAAHHHSQQHALNYQRSTSARVGDEQHVGVRHTNGQQELHSYETNDRTVQHAPVPHDGLTGTTRADPVSGRHGGKPMTKSLKNARSGSNKVTDLPAHQYDAAFAEHSMSVPVVPMPGTDMCRVDNSDVTGASEDVLDPSNVVFQWNNSNNVVGVPPVRTHPNVDAMYRSSSVTRDFEKSTGIAHGGDNYSDALIMKMNERLSTGSDVLLAAGGGKHIAGTHTTGTHIAGTHTTGTHIAGTHTTGTHITGTHTTGTYHGGNGQDQLRNSSGVGGAYARSNTYGVPANTGMYGGDTGRSAVKVVYTDGIERRNTTDSIDKRYACNVSSTVPPVHTFIENQEHGKQYSPPVVGPNAGGDLGQRLSSRHRYTTDDNQYVHGLHQHAVSVSQHRTGSRSAEYNKGANLVRMQEGIEALYRPHSTDERNVATMLTDGTIATGAGDYKNASTGTVTTSASTSFGANIFSGQFSSFGSLRGDSGTSSFRVINSGGSGIKAERGTSSSQMLLVERGVSNATTVATVHHAHNRTSNNDYQKQHSSDFSSRSTGTQNWGCSMQGNDNNTLMHFGTMNSSQYANGIHNANLPQRQESLSRVAYPSTQPPTTGDGQQRYNHQRQHSRSSTHRPVGSNSNSKGRAAKGGGVMYRQNPVEPAAALLW